MYNVIINPKIFEKIRDFGQVYRDIFIERFTNTGLGSAENIIKKQYIESAELLVDTIVDSIYSTLSNFIYFTHLGNGQRETSFRLGNRRIFLTYDEDEATLTRYITDIEILRK